MYYRYPTENCGGITHDIEFIAQLTASLIVKKRPLRLIMLTLALHMYVRIKYVNYILLSPLMVKNNTIIITFILCLQKETLKTL